MLSESLVTAMGDARSLRSGPLVLDFRGHQTIGRLAITSRGNAGGSVRTYAAAAGTIVVPGSSEVRLDLDDTGPVNLSVLDQLPPDAIQHLRALNAIISDAELVHVGRLIGLLELNLSQSTVGDEGMGHLAGLKALRALHLSRTQVTDDGLKSIAPLAALEKLALGATSVTDRGLAYLEDMSVLRNLRLSWTRVTGSGLGHLRRLGQLRTLDLDGTAVDDASLVHLRGHPFLSSLNLAGTRVTDAAIRYLSELRCLRTVDLSWTAVTSEGLHDLENLVPGCEIKYYGPSAASRLAASGPRVDPFGGGSRLAIRVREADVAVFVACLAVGTLTGIRSGELPLQAAEGLVGLADATRGFIPRELTRVLGVIDDLGSLAGTTVLAERLDGLVDAILAELEARGPEADVHFEARIERAAEPSDPT